MEYKKSLRKEAITIKLENELYIKVLNLSNEKGVDMSKQINFILWDYFQNTSLK